MRYCRRDGILIIVRENIPLIAKVEPRMRILVREAHVVLSIVPGLSARQSARRCRADILQDLRSRSLRVGYSVSSEAASRLSALRLQNGVTIVSAKAAIAALEDGAYVRMAAKRNADDRQEFMNQVNARMLHAIDAHANFVLLNPLRSVSEVFLHLGKNDVHVAPSISAMERYIRVSLGTPAEMRELARRGSHARR